jgi:hypothetical protein
LPPEGGDANKKRVDGVGKFVPFVSIVRDFQYFGGVNNNV